MCLLIRFDLLLQEFRSCISSNLCSLFECFCYFQSFVSYLTEIQANIKNCDSSVPKKLHCNEVYLTLILLPGTKIVYERSFMLNLRNSPLSKTPPNFTIPEHLTPGGSPTRQINHHNHHPHRRSSNHHNQPPKSPLGKTPPREERKKSTEPVDDQFQIDL